MDELSSIPSTENRIVTLAKDSGPTIQSFIPSTILQDIPKLESKEFLANNGFSDYAKERSDFKKQIRFTNLGKVKLFANDPSPTATLENNTYTRIKNENAPKGLVPVSEAAILPTQPDSTISATTQNLPAGIPAPDASLLDISASNAPTTPSQETDNIYPQNTGSDVNFTNAEPGVDSKNHKKQSTSKSKAPKQTVHPAMTPSEIGTSKYRSLSPTSVKAESQVTSPREIAINEARKKGFEKNLSNVFSNLKTYLDPATVKRPLPLTKPWQPSRSVLDQNIGTSVSSTAAFKEELLIAGQPSRKEVMSLREKMHNLLQKYGVMKVDHHYPSDIQSLLSLVQQENAIYDTVFQEIIRHVTTNLFERGELLLEIRQRYLNMFQQIPRIVESTYANYVAQCLVNRKLKKEIVRTRDELQQLTEILSSYKDLNHKIVKDSDYKRMMENFLKAEHVDDILKEYHTVYRWQRSRMEDHIKRVEKEKKIWVDAATCLSLRIATDHGLPDVAQLQRYEYGRMRAVNHINAILQSHHLEKCKVIETQMTSWLQKISKCAFEIDRSDKKSLQILTRTIREMKQVQMMLEVRTPEFDEIHRIVGPSESKKYSSVECAAQLEELSLKSLHVSLKDWVEQINGVSIRYTSERDEHIVTDLSSLQRTLHEWLDPCYSILRKAQKTESGSIYMDLQYELNDLKAMLDGWLGQLKVRITGDDGLASQIISIQNHIEDKYTILASKLGSDTISAEEKISLIEVTAHWSNQLNTMSSEYLNGTTSLQESRLPMQTELWLTKLMDQLSTDSELQKEDNFRLHNSVVHWMVQLLMKTGLKAPDKSWDTELGNLHDKMNTKIGSLLRNSAGIELLSDDRKNLKDIIQYYADIWYETAMKLLEKEKKNTIILLENRKRNGLALPSLVGRAIKLSKAPKKFDFVSDSEDLHEEISELQNINEQEGEMSSGEEVEDELDVDSSYLEAGQDGKGSYPDVKGVEPQSME